MKKALVILLAGMSALTLVSCGNELSDSVSNKYPVENYLAKGATLDGYYNNGTAKLTDTNGTVFFAGNDSSYKVVLNDKGVVLPYIVVNGTTYYFDENDTVKTLPESFSKQGKASLFGGDQTLVTDQEIASSSFLQYLSVFIDENDSNLIYAQFKGEDGYQAWKTAEEIE